MESAVDVVNRYHDAVAYVDRVIDTVEKSGGVVDREIANPLKTQVARAELQQIKSRWLRSTADSERTRIARDAELLADRVQENLPGAPQDRRRSNLFKGEKERSTPATSFDSEIANRAAVVWDWVKREAKEASSPATIRGLLFWGGALAVGYVAVSALTHRSDA